MMFLNHSFAQDIGLRRASHPLHPNDAINSDSAYLDPELEVETNASDIQDQKQWIVQQLKYFPKPASANSYKKEKYGAIIPITSSDKGQDEAWLELKINLLENVLCDGVALVPALFPESSIRANYAFPKRFKVEAFKIEDPDTSITLADWTQEDFPDPGLSPVIFSTKGIHIYKIRMTVYKGLETEDQHFFALDEMLIFRHGLNIAPLLEKRLKASQHSNYPPFWKLEYMMDGSSHLGDSLGPKINKNVHGEQDFILYYENRFPEKQKNLTTTITIDLGETHSIDRVEFFSAYDPASPIPNLPLPYYYKIDLLESLEPEIITKSIKSNNKGHYKSIAHSIHSYKGRYVRCTFTLLPSHMRQPTLAIGEIRVTGDTGADQGFLELDKKVTLTSSDPDRIVYSTPTKSLVDGLSNGKPIKMEQIFMEQLAKRALVKKAQRKMFEQYPLAVVKRTRYYWISAFSFVALTALALSFLSSKMRRQKREEIRTMQQQIAADLHDDISGNLGTIAMISNRINKLTDTPVINEKLKEIEHLSKESYISIKEIIWHTDSAKLTFASLIKQIKRTAESISNDCEITYQLPKDDSVYLSLEVPASMRRNIMLLVKESLFNCAKYANASHVLIKADIIPTRFTQHGATS